MPRSRRPCQLSPRGMLTFTLVLPLFLACGRERPRDDAAFEDTLSAAPPPVLMPADTALLGRVPPDTTLLDSTPPGPAAARRGTADVAPPRTMADTPPKADASSETDTSSRADTSRPDSAVKPNIDPRPTTPLPRIPREGVPAQ